MTERDAFLLAIAESPDDDARRLVFSDWLEENNDLPRAELLRVQCELASPKLAPGRRDALRRRERELLDAGRRGWIEACGLPVESVSFERGLIARARLSSWDGGRTLDPAASPWLVALTELDLSGLGLGDAGVSAFARTARLPALRKLLLNDNGISDAGAAALAGATGLPRLDTAYLFGNAIGDAGREALWESSILWATLDFGERAEGYCMSPGEADVARRRFIREDLLPVVSRYFADHKHLRSAMLCVAQYWADEADDAVHASLIVSELDTPTLKGVGWEQEEGVPDRNIPNTRLASEYYERPSSAVSLYDTGTRWDDNNGAIPLWAAFAPEGGTQDTSSLSDSYSPAVLFYRHGGHEILPMLRPYLDGVRPEWG